MGDLFVTEGGPGGLRRLWALHPARRQLTLVSLDGADGDASHAARALGGLDSELRGTCLDPSGRVLYANLPARTYAIWGPWSRSRDAHRVAA